MKKRFTTLLAVSVALATPLSTSFAESQLTEQEALNKMEIHQKNWNDKQNNPSFLSGKLSDKKVRNQKEVQAFLEENKRLFKVNPSTDLVFKEVTTDELGMRHYVYTQSVNSIPVDGVRFVVHTDSAGNVTTVNGELHPNVAKSLNKNIKPQITKDVAFTNAWEHIKLSKNDTLVEMPGNVVNQVKAELENTNEEANLVVYEKDGDYHVAYKVTLQFIKPYAANWHIYVNAKDGNILEAYNAVADADTAAVGSGYGVRGDWKSINTVYSSTYGSYHLRDTTKPMSGVIETFTVLNSSGGSPTNYYLFDRDNAWTSKEQGPAVDAHYNAGKVYDYYKNVHNRNSFDGRGKTIRSGINYGVNENNAFWNGQQMVYGDGDGQKFAPLSGAIDVVAHELTHAVTQYSAGLEYINQSGALNESFSDVFGYFLDPQDWDCGEDVYTPGIDGDALRSLSNPEKYGQPAHMNNYQNLPPTQEGDNGGVHINSGIPNKAAYLTISAIGKEQAEKIYYRALTLYLTPTSDFKQAREALLQATADYYGYGSVSYNAVVNAWNQVGVN
ncbi:M4 family metallopeptidase [Bacillus cereus]